MLDLGIPPDKIGASDPDHGFRHAAFHPGDRTGGSVTPDGRITVESGVVNPDLLARDYDADTVKRWRLTRLTRLGDRLQAIAIHEEAEGASGSHEEALAQAPQTQRPISRAARELLGQMERGWKER